ncbi:MAG: cyclophilin-like fold protein [Acetobacteraceae bacterium]|nr:cyclophilin-like fold protein [Acetobacteraceae bacterium]
MKAGASLVVVTALLLGGSLTAKVSAQPTERTNVSPTTGAPSHAVSAQRILMTIDRHDFEVSLYDNAAAAALLKTLPQTISMSRWGNGEYYGKISSKIPADGEKREYFERGEVALWPEGNALCIFFDRTPVSSDERPKMASPGIPFGRITKGDLTAFKGMPGDFFTSIKLELKPVG